MNTWVGIILALFAAGLIIVSIIYSSGGGNIKKKIEHRERERYKKQEPANRTINNENNTLPRIDDNSMYCNSCNA